MILFPAFSRRFAYPATLCFLLFFMVGAWADPNAPKKQAPLPASGIVVDSSSNVYVTDPQHHVIRKIAPDGTPSVLVGITGKVGFTNEGEPLFNQPSGLAIDKTGKLYVVDTGNNAVRSITISDSVPVVSTVCPIVDGKDVLQGPIGIAVDSNAGVYVLENGNVRKILPDKKNIFPAKNSNIKLQKPTGIVADAEGNVYLTDDNFDGIYKITPEGASPIPLQCKKPNVIATDPTHRLLYIAETGYNVIWSYAISGGTLAKVYPTGEPSQGGTNVPLSSLTGIAVTSDTNPNLFCIDQSNDRILKIVSGTVTPFIEGIGSGPKELLSGVLKRLNETEDRLTKLENSVAAVIKNVQTLNNEVREQKVSVESVKKQTEQALRELQASWEQKLKPTPPNSKNIRQERRPFLVLLVSFLGLLCTGVAAWGFFMARGSISKLTGVLAMYKRLFSTRFMEINSQGNILTVSKGFAEILGYPKEELMGKNLSELALEESEKLPPPHLLEVGEGVHQINLQSKSGRAVSVTVSFLPTTGKKTQKKASETVAAVVVPSEQMENLLSAEILALTERCEGAFYAESASGQVIAINSVFCNLAALSLPAETAFGMPSSKVRASSTLADAAGFWNEADTVAQKQTPAFNEEVKISSKVYYRSYEPIMHAQQKIGNIWIYREKPEVIPQKPTLKPGWKDLPAPTPWAPPQFGEQFSFCKRYAYTNVYSLADATLEGWSVVGATRRGRTHAHAGTHRDDAFAWKIGKQFAIYCVADGAGSCKYSRVGAEMMCRHVCEDLPSRLKGSGIDPLADMDKFMTWIGTAMSESVVQGSEILKDAALKLQCEPKDFRCTFLLAVHYKNQGVELLLTNQIGDGAIIALHTDGCIKQYGTSDSGQFSGEVTCFVPDPDVINKSRQIRSINMAETEAVLLCTDGVEDAFFPIGKEAGAIFRQLYNGVENALPGFENQVAHGPILGEKGDYRRLEDWLGFEKRGENDDRTAVVLYKNPVQISLDALRPATP